MANNARTKRNKVGVHYSRPDAELKPVAYDGDVGYDIVAARDYTVPPGTMVEILTGVHLALPKNMFAQVNTRSSHGRNGFFVHHGVIDSGFTGEISVFFFNACATIDRNGVIYKNTAIIRKGDKIAQILFHRAERPALEFVEELPKTERGDKAFGSTDKQ